MTYNLKTFNIGCGLKIEKKVNPKLNSNATPFVIASKFEFLYMFFGFQWGT